MNTSSGWNPPTIPMPSYTPIEVDADGNWRETGRDLSGNSLSDDEAKVETGAFLVDVRIKLTIQIDAETGPYGKGHANAAIIAKHMQMQELLDNRIATAILSYSAPRIVR